MAAASGTAAPAASAAPSMPRRVMPLRLMNGVVVKSPPPVVKRAARSVRGHGGTLPPARATRHRPTGLRPGAGAAALWRGDRWTAYPVPHMLYGCFDVYDGPGRTGKPGRTRTWRPG
ncbi:hypothetical protein GCM10010302_40130 [Streptomyces polychromogenes]|uniref:Uncharacterized protein n=1 Tax=Streptomyces polychromogenes TaxID=67342 RepID=A0ABN0VFW1_9ACTN